MKAYDIYLKVERELLARCGRSVVEVVLVVPGDGCRFSACQRFVVVKVQKGNVGQMGWTLGLDQNTNQLESAKSRQM